MSVAFLLDLDAVAVNDIGSSPESRASYRRGRKPDSPSVLPHHTATSSDRGPSFDRHCLTSGIAMPSWSEVASAAGRSDKKSHEGSRPNRQHA